MLGTNIGIRVEGVDMRPLEEQADRHYGEIRRELERIVRTIGYTDLLIAAHARLRDATLVAHNTARFSRVPCLAVEDWLVEV